MPTKINVEIVADSISPQDHRITTIRCTFPRYILAELNTHRVFSRNSASSRAIPFNKMVEVVQDDPFIPYKWMKDHSGMQGNEYLNESDAYWARKSWLVARDYAVQQSKLLNNKYNLTKQMANRILEPFMWHTALITSTEWENFFSLRFNESADIHIQVLAEEILNAMNNHIPTLKEEGEWHIPFGDKIDEDGLGNIIFDKYTKEELKIQRAIARVARTSYTIVINQNKIPSIKADLDLYGKLLHSGHMSPFEHVAQVPTDKEYELNVMGQLEWTEGMYAKPLPKDEAMGWFGNFRGWKQYRKMLPNENRSDSRLVKTTYKEIQSLLS